MARLSGVLLTRWIHVVIDPVFGMDRRVMHRPIRVPSLRVMVMNNVRRTDVMIHPVRGMLYGVPDCVLVVVVVLTHCH